MQDFQNLTVWQDARRLTKAVYEISADMPPSETFGLRSQMRRASVSICSNIAEGCGRRGDREFRRHLVVAMGSACELECELILAVDLALIDEEKQSIVRQQVVGVKRMLSGLMKCLSDGTSGSKSRT